MLVQHKDITDKSINQISNDEVTYLSKHLHQWQIKLNGTEV